MKDRRNNNQNDRLKHIVNEMQVANIALQLAMSDLSHYMKDKQELEKEDDIDEHSGIDSMGEKTD